MSVPRDFIPAVQLVTRPRDKPINATTLAEELERDRHGISRELASTGARAWAGMVFEIFEFGIGHLA